MLGSLAPPCSCFWRREERGERREREREREGEVERDIIESCSKVWKGVFSGVLGHQTSDVPWWYYNRNIYIYPAINIYIYIYTLLHIIIVVVFHFKGLL